MLILLVFWLYYTSHIRSVQESAAIIRDGPEGMEHERKELSGYGSLGLHS